MNLFSVGLLKKCVQLIPFRNVKIDISKDFIELSKTNEVLQAEFVNYNLNAIYFTAYNTFGFQLSDDTKILGPCAVFPRNVFSWNVGTINDINEKSLSLFFNLTPKIDILVIGKGLSSEPVEYRRIERICSEHNVGVEILSTPSAIGCFNILSSEGRYVGGAMIPPPIIDRADEKIESLRKISVEDKSGISLLSNPSKNAVLSLPLTWSERRRIEEQKKFIKEQEEKNNTDK